MAINYKQAALLCTRNELKLVERCKPGVLTSRTLAEVTEDAHQARGYFDKWRQKAITDARGRQRKAGARGARVNPGFDRSAAKAELFRDVLAKIEKRMEKIEREMTAEIAKATRESGPAAKKTTVKKEAVSKKQAAVKKKRAAKKAPVKKKAAAKKAAAKKRAVKKKRAAVNAALEASARKTTRGGARAAARKRVTSARVASSGYTSRVRGHVSASNRRAQARRNTRR